MSTDEIKVRAERKAGELLAAMPKAKGAAGLPGPGRGNAVPMENRVSDTPTLADLGVTKAQSARWQKLAAMPKAKGARGNPGGQGAPIVRLPDDTAQTLADLGVTHD